MCTHVLVCVCVCVYCIPCATLYMCPVKGVLPDPVLSMHLHARERSCSGIPWANLGALLWYSEGDPDQHREAPFLPSLQRP